MAPVVPQGSRRRFLRRCLALAGAGVLAGCSPAPPAPRVRRIGYLTVTISGHEQLRRLDMYEQALLNTFLRAMQEAGYAEGQNVAVETRWAEAGQEDRLASLAGELARLPVDLLVAVGGAAAVAAQQAAPTVPVLFLAVGDPLGIGLVASLNRPGGNVTGLSSLSPELSGKRLELLRMGFPGVSRVAVFQHQNDPDAAAAIRQMAGAAPTLGMQLRHLSISGLSVGGSGSSIHQALESVTAWPADALITLGPYNHWTALTTAAARAHLPTLSDRREFVFHAGVMAYGPDLEAMFRRAAAFADKILRGVGPAELPVEQPTGFRLSLNLGNAANAGLTVSSDILLQADEVIR